MLMQVQVLFWTSLFATVIIHLSDSSNESTYTLNFQKRLSTPAFVQHPTKVNGLLKLKGTYLNASNGSHYIATVGTNTITTHQTKFSTAKHNFEKQRFPEASVRKTTGSSTIVTQVAKSFSANQNGEKTHKNHNQIKLKLSNNQPRQNVQISVLTKRNPKFPVKARNTPNSKSNNGRKYDTFTKTSHTTAPPLQNCNFSHKSGSNIQGGSAVISLNYPLKTGGHVSKPASNKISNPPTNYDANILDYKKRTVRIHHSIVSNAGRLNETSVRRNYKKMVKKSSSIRTTSTTTSILNDNRHVPVSNNRINDKAATYQLKLARAKTLNDDKDIPDFLFRCLPNEKLDCLSYENYLYVVNSVLLKPESLKDDLELMHKIYTLLQNINVTWPENYVFNKTKLAIVATDSMVTIENKYGPQSDELNVKMKYKYLREVFPTIAAAPHKPGDVFITDIVKEIIKIKSVFVKRKILDFLFYKIMNPGYVDNSGAGDAEHFDNSD